MNKSDDSFHYNSILGKLLEKKYIDESEIYRFINRMFWTGFQCGAVYTELNRADSDKFIKKITCENDANRDKIVYDREIIYIDDSGVSVTKMDIKRALNNNIAQITEVEYIYMLQENESFHVWTIINEMNIETMEKIYEKEIEIFDIAPSIFIDFHVLIRNDRPIQNMPLTGSEQIFVRN